MWVTPLFSDWGWCYINLKNRKKRKQQKQQNGNNNDVSSHLKRHLTPFETFDNHLKHQQKCIQQGKKKKKQWNNNNNDVFSHLTRGTLTSRATCSQGQVRIRCVFTKFTKRNNWMITIGVHNKNLINFGWRSRGVYLQVHVVLPQPGSNNAHRVDKNQKPKGELSDEVPFAKEIFQVTVLL